MFQGFYDETIQFLWELRLNNNRPWFLAHKQTYLDCLYEPMKALGAELQARMLERHPKLLLNLKVARIYRDARRVRDGRPYKDHLWLTLSDTAGPIGSVPVFYFEVAPEGYEYGLGYYCPRPAQMGVFREQVLADPKGLERLVRRFNRQSLFQLYGEEYKRPKGQVSELLRPWFNRKQIGLAASFPPDEIFLSPALADRVTEGFDWLMPFYRYFP